ncbi:MAG: RsmB/NOP family class I SAM-dependent RNA methyltransferase [Verrucomicrobia bacterium]|nr:RsmB/NOP family class I SAM-dependent RNA methyltransferase [Verrucomicrobiota bacterium]
MVGRSDRAHPADVVLREELRRAGGLSRADSREISRAVFAYYRWLGWLDQQESVVDRIEKAVELRERFSAQPNIFTDQELAAKAVPVWVADEMEVSPAWAKSLQTEPPLWLRARRGQARMLAERLGECWVGDGVLNDAIRYEGSEDLFRTPEFHNGEFELQDINSQAVGLLCDPQPGETWWDACAGEGGKLLHLSDLMENRGLILASDRVEWRLKKLKQRAARAKAFNYRVAIWNGGERLPTKTKFDGVLVDAPCTGVGTWQRNPHARWTVTPDDVRELSEVQKQMLANAAAAVKPGGKLIYSVCTMTRAETDEVAEVFGEQFPQFKSLTLANPFRAKESAPRLWFWPQETRGNGMFLAAWQRRG